MVAAVEKAYLESLKDKLRQMGGRCDCAQLGGVRRPDDAFAGRKLKTILQAHAAEYGFAITNHSGSGACVVWLTQQAAPHVLGDSMRETLVHLSRRFRSTTWPVTRDQLADAVPARTGKVGQLLWQLSRGNYVVVTGGTSLKWNVPRIHDAISKIALANPAAELKASGPPGAAALRPAPAPPATRPGNAPPTPTPPNTRPAAAQPDEGVSRLGEYELLLVDTEAGLALIASRHVFLSPRGTVAIACEGVPDALHLIQVATAEPQVYVFDCVKLGAPRVCSVLQPLLESQSALKIFHGLHKHAYALAVHGRVGMRRVLDTQLVAEHAWAWGEVFTGFNDLLCNLKLPQHPTKYAMKARMQGQSGASSVWSKRPLPKSDVEYAALDATLLLGAWPQVRDSVGDELDILVAASEERAAGAMVNDGARVIAFDVANDYAIASAELLKHTRPADAYSLCALVPVTEAVDMLNLLPRDLRRKLEPPSAHFQFSLWPPQSTASASASPVEAVNLDDVVDIILDVGRRATCWVGSKRVMLSDVESRLITKNDLDFAMQQLGPFGSDGRAGLDRKLHRISAMKIKDGKAVVGLTMRVGRSVRGNADMMVDILLGSDKSVLVLGEPGSGKTTIIREAARLLADRLNVVVVDTSNEIAGDGMVPHPCIGLARRMMVPSLDAQSGVMVECVQNHTPHVMIIDEIGRPKEVAAARTVKQRGVRLIASAHGDLRKLLKNNELKGLVGGVTSITVGDAMAKEEAKKHGGNISKTIVQREGEPTFDVVIEVRRGARDEWRVSTDVAGSVDAILEGQEYKAQRRLRDPRTGAIQFEFVRA